MVDCCTRIKCAEHNNKQQFEATIESLLYTGYIKVVATL